MLVYGLFITPHFTPEMEQGKEPAPYINHNTVDWVALGQSLAEFFQMANYNVTLRMADDTVDQVTIHLREAGINRGSIDCKDFGNALLGIALDSTENPVHVQPAWANLHQLKDRSEAPPPVMLPLIFEGDRFDIAELVYTMMHKLGVKAAHHPEKLLSLQPLPEDFHQGYLPESLMALMKDHFGVGYKPYALLTRLST